jgi:hypothetical protein
MTSPTAAAPGPAGPGPVSLDRFAASATTHCLTGCAIGEVLGLVIATALGWSDAAAIALAVALAFVFGYALTLRPLLGAGMAFRAAMALALAADTVSITVMEIVDNAVMLAIPGAMDAGLGELRFWGSLAVALAIAWVAAFPVNRWLIGRGRGHAVVHARHGGHSAGHGTGRRSGEPGLPRAERGDRSGERPAGGAGQVGHAGGG